MVALGLVGVVVPVMPTTPFLLVALWFFARSSEKLKHWLLTNRVFGSYIRNYRSGRGIPVRMKVWTLALLWTSITCSALLAIDAMWLRIMLFAIAVAVSVHILTQGRRRRVVVLVPTAQEAEYLEDATICGVGMAAVSAAVVRIAKRRRRPRMVILAGIAGACPESGLQVGDCVVVSSETVGDLPAAYRQTYLCEWAEQVTVLQRVAGSTVSRVGAGEGAVENMEGAAFFAACEAAGLPFLEVRAVSNLTTDRREQWRTDAAAKALAAGLQMVTDEIEA
jgi:uncharacterized membrane protein YbaN (DUF454 family)